MSQTGFEATVLLVKMAAPYLRPTRSLPLANMAAAPLLLPTVVKPVCPQLRWWHSVCSGAWRLGCCGEGTGRGAGLAAGSERVAGRGEARGGEAAPAASGG